MSKKVSVRVLLAIAAALACASARADFVFRMGDDVHVNGKVYTQEEWNRIKNDPRARAEAEGKAPAAQPASAQPAAAPAVATAAPAPARIVGPRAATCRTTRMYDEFPEEGEKFACSGNLGSLSREQLLDAGWKIDLIEKLPAPAGAPATSARGLPLSSYKLILSR